MDKQPVFTTTPGTPGLGAGAKDHPVLHMDTIELAQEVAGMHLLDNCGVDPVGVDS